MKKISLILCCLWSCCHVWGADYLSPSFRWDVEMVLEDGIYTTSTIKVGKDTVIEGKTYRLVDNYYPMRQSSDSIIMYDRDNLKEVLLYDFALQVGDSIEQLEDPFGSFPARFAKVVKISTVILADGREARKIEYEQEFPAPRGADIEFVGSAHGGILGPLDNSICERELIAFYDGEKLVYPDKNANALEHLCNRWNVLMDSGFELGPVYGEIWTDGYQIQGDTIINKMHYSRLLFANGKHKQQSKNWEWVYYGAIRETSNEEIYVIPAGQSSEYLLFAFNAKVGDKFNNLYVMNNDYSAWALVKEISEKEIILDLYEQLDENIDIFWSNYVWVRGIGAKHSMFQPLPNGEVGGCVVNSLLCAYNDDTQLYTSDTGEEYGCEYNGEKTSEAIDNIPSELPTAAKLFHDGQILILRDGKVYTITGQTIVVR